MLPVRVRVRLRIAGTFCFVSKPGHNVLDRSSAEMAIV